MIYLMRRRGGGRRSRHASEGGCDRSDEVETSSLFISSVKTDIPPAEGPAQHPAGPPAGGPLARHACFSWMISLTTKLNPVLIPASPSPKNKRGNSLGDRPRKIIFGQVNNQLKVNKQLNSSTFLNFHSKHI